MKKFVFVMSVSVFVLSMSFSVYAFDKGTIAINPYSGARITVFENDDDLDYNALAVEAELGYFIADDIELGLGIGYYDYSESGSDDDNVSEHYFRPYVEFYFPVSSNYYFAGISYYINSEDNDFSDTYTDDVTSLSLEGGYKWMLADNISMDFSLLYEIGKFERSGDFVGEYDYSRINLLTGFKFYL